MTSVSNLMTTSISDNLWVFSGVAAGVAFGAAAKVYRCGTDWFFQTRSAAPPLTAAACKPARRVWKLINRIRDMNVGHSDYQSEHIVNPCQPGPAPVLTIPSLLFLANILYQQGFSEVSENDIENRNLFAINLLLLPVFLGFSVHFVSDLIREKLQELPAFRKMDISGHALQQGAFSVQMALTMHALQHAPFPLSIETLQAFLAPVVMSDLVWTYETIANNYHSVADAVAGLGCSALAYIGVSLITSVYLHLLTMKVGEQENG